MWCNVLALLSTWSIQALSRSGHLVLMCTTNFSYYSIVMRVKCGHEGKIFTRDKVLFYPATVFLYEVIFSMSSFVNKFITGTEVWDMSVVEKLCCLLHQPNCKFSLFCYLTAQSRLHYRLVRNCPYFCFLHSEWMDSRSMSELSRFFLLFFSTISLFVAVPLHPVNIRRLALRCSKGNLKSFCGAGPQMFACCR